MRIFTSFRIFTVIWLDLVDDLVDDLVKVNQSLVRIT